MANEPTISTSGVFFDLQAEKVVDSPPAEGVQIVAPGGQVTAEAEAEIARYRDIENGVVRLPQTLTSQPVIEAAVTEGAEEAAETKPARGRAKG